VEELVSAVRTSLEDDKAEDIQVLDVTGRASFTDRMVIATGQVERQIQAMATHLEEALEKAGLKLRRDAIQGSPDWVLIDAGDLVIHLFRPEARATYALERMWGPDSPRDEAPPGAAADGGDGKGRRAPSPSPPSAAAPGGASSWAVRPPHALQRVGRARLGPEQVDHQVAGIDQHPVRRALDRVPPQLQPGLLERLFQVRRHGLDLPLDLAGGDHHAVGEGRPAGDVQHLDVLRLVVLQAGADGRHQLLHPFQRRLGPARRAGGPGRPLRTGDRKVLGRPGAARPRGRRRRGRRFSVIVVGRGGAAAWACARCAPPRVGTGRA
jgi:ribosome silencing factor RsfS/YbeB/iojap